MPFDSARIQICQQAIDADKISKSVYLEMTDNILKKLRCNSITRLNVNFKIEDRTLSSFIGRTAHIQMLESEPMIKALIYKYA